MGTIWMDQRQSPNLFEASHSVVVPVADNKHLVTLTGVVLLEYKGITSDDWRRDHIVMGIKLPPELQASWIQIEYWAPFVTINSIYNQDEAINAGWAVDRFGLQPHLEMKYKEVVEIEADLAVRDSDGYIYRLAYNFTFVGRITTPPPGPK